LPAIAEQCSRIAPGNPLVARALLDGRDSRRGEGGRRERVRRAVARPFRRARREPHPRVILDPPGYTGRMPDTHRLKPGQTVRLDEIEADGKKLHDDRDEAEQEFAELRRELADWQKKLYAEGRRKLLVVLQAMDTGGKDGTIRAVFEGVNPQGVGVTSFKVPTEEERSRDFLWRIHRAVPAAGMIGVFNRSHYEDVLVVRVDELVPEEVWRERYAQINAFESLLAHTGTRILKFYLHIEKDEQKKRLQERLENPEKQWKFDPADLDKRKQWDDYMAAYEEAFERCTTDVAPWYVIPADQNWYRNLAIARVLVDTLREMNPTYPSSELDRESLESLRVE
jgi:PPK2 family polyphosphate:nucleotide phosphotransferase